MPASLRQQTIDRLAPDWFDAEKAPDGWEDWTRAVFPSYITAPFAARHIELWEWVEALKKGVNPEPFVALWPRGGAKSSTAEMAVVRAGAKQVRKYIWYTCETQDQSDKHVETISAMLESPQVERYHPELARRKLGKYGHSRGWRRSRLRTESGLTVDALGLDKAVRGAKTEQDRPDLIIFDDVDGRHDTMQTIKKKIEIITSSILPAGSSDLAVMFVQNLIHPNSIASKLASNEAEFLADRKVSGPFPAIQDFTYEQRDGKFYITGGEPTWEGQNLAICQAQISLWGFTTFLEEAQQEVNEPSGGVWDHLEYRRCKIDEVPDIVRGCVWVDPAVTSTDESDCNGIQADGIATDGTIYRFYSWEGIDGPERCIRRAILKCLELGFNRVGIETDQGGDTWYSVYNRVWEHMLKEKPGLAKKRLPEYRFAKAGFGVGSKVERNSRMLTNYEQGQVVHVIGTNNVLERALRRFPNKPLDMADAAFWSWNDLRGGGGWVRGMGS